MVLDDAYHFLQLRGLAGNHCTVQEPPPFGNPNLTSGPLQTLSLTPNGASKAIVEDHQAKARLLIWSAADEGGLARLAKVYHAHFSRLPSERSSDKANAYLESLAYTLSARRSFLSWRAYAAITSVSELQDLAAKLSKPVRSRSQPKLGYIFTGQGAQHAGMAKELMAYPIFKRSLLHSQVYLYDLGCSWSLLGIFSCCRFRAAKRELITPQMN